MADEDAANDKSSQIEAGNSKQQKSTSGNSPTKQKKDSLAMGKGQFFGLDRKYFFGGGNDLGGASPTAETRSAPGDLSKLPRAWHHHMDDLLRRNGRAGTQQPGTSQMKRERRQKRDGNSRKNDDGTAEDESSPAKMASAHKMARRSQPDTAAVPHNTAHTPLLLNGQPIRQQSQPQKRRGHLRGTRSNGFASAPPFPKHPSGKDGSAERNGVGEDEDMDDDQYYPWGQQPMNERQKQQQMALIEHELNVMANETLCGLGRWRPGWIQRFARKEWMLILLCWFCTIQGMIVNGLFPSSISTIERRFQFSTSTLGRIMQFYDFGYVLFCIPVSYFGGRHSKSTVLSTGLLLMSLGSLVFTLPHFIADPYTSSYQSDASALSKCFSNDTFYTTSTQISLASNLSSSADSLVEGAEFDALTACPSPENQPGTFRFVFLFCLAHFMHGVGATPLYTIGVSYIDENVGPALSSLYIGIFYAFAIFGPAIGFFASSKFLLWHSDFMNTGQKLQKLIIDLDETDPKWVGAWYLGFLLAAFLGLLAVFPILAFPKLLPESLKWHRTRLQEETMGAKKRSPECCGMPPSNRTTAAVFNSTSVANGAHIDSNFDESSEKAVVIHQFQSTMPALKSRQGPIWYQLWLDVRHIPIAIYKILLNGPYMLITLGMSIDGLIVTGCSTFMSKYLERQFGVAPSKATLFMGAVMVPMAGFGTMFSGIIIHRFRLSCVRTLQYCIALVLCSLLLSPMYFIYCDHDQLVGIERHYPVDDAPANHYDESTDAYIYKLNVQCNAQCQCSPTEYHPVCAERIDGSQMAFYSPCYAGCPQPYSVEQKEYLNCSCVPDETKGGIRRVKKGFCESKCRGLFAFMVFFAPFCFFTFAVGIALITVVLRTVDYDERSFALGIQWILVRIIGTIPAPVVFGWLFDFSCIRQHLDPCSGEHGSCMLYHNKSLADLFLAFTVAGQLVALVCLIGVLMFFANSLRDDPLPATAADAPENNVEAATINQLPEEEPFTGGKRDRHKQIGETDDDDDDELVKEEDECCRNGEKALMNGKSKDADGMVENSEAT